MNPQTDPTYEELLARAARLQPDQQLLLLEGLATIVRRRIASDEKKKRSVLELQGLGKETWGGVDARKHVERERGSWNG